MRLSTITTFLLILGGFASSVSAQYHHPRPHSSYDRGQNFYNYNRYGARTGYGYNPYVGLPVVNPLYLNNLSYPLYGGVGSYSNLPFGLNGLATSPYPYGSQQYRWAFFRAYGYFPY